MSLLQTSSFPIISRPLERPEYLTLDDISERRQWQKIKVKRFKGQMKLFASTLRAFVEFRLKKDVHYTVLYIGSAPGSNFYILLQFFKHYKLDIHLYDLATHDKRFDLLPNVTVHRQYFLDKDIMRWKDIKNLIFISDIRSVDGDEPSLENILHDNNLQMRCVLELKPFQSVLKLRYPFPDQVTNDFFFEILEGKQNLQIFTSDSNERRLIVTDLKSSEKSFKTLKICFDDLVKSEESMAFYNHFKKGNDFELQVFQYFMLPVLKDNLIDLDLSSLNDVEVFLKTISNAIFDYRVKRLPFKQKMSVASFRVLNQYR